MADILFKYSKHLLVLRARRKRLSLKELGQFGFS